MFNHLSPLPDDPILGLLIAYQADQRPNKIDLGVGVFKDSAGNTPILASVKQAEQQRFQSETTKTYLGSAGVIEFNQLMTQQAFGEQHPKLTSNSIRTLATPGGTGALRASAEFLKVANPEATIWLSDPTWTNHIDIFKSAGFTVKHYPYYDHQHHGVNFAAMRDCLQQLGANDVVLLHACCHNPSGADLSPAQWDDIVSIVAQNKIFPLIDMAYQGFGDGLEQDAYGVRAMAAVVEEMILCSSCSKNFGLYRERIGALSLVAADPQQADTAASVLQGVVRTIYSMPPAHGAFIVANILGNETLKQQWLAELAAMREQIFTQRQQLAEKLNALALGVDFSFITQEKGMFSFLGLTPAQVTRLKEEFSIYMVQSSRINLAGINEHNIDYLVASIAQVITESR